LGKGEDIPYAGGMWKLRNVTIIGVNKLFHHTCKFYSLRRADS